MMAFRESDFYGISTSNYNLRSFFYRGGKWNYYGLSLVFLLAVQ